MNIKSSTIILLQLLISSLGGYSHATEVLDEPITPIPHIEISDPDIVNLGKKLFHDARFSSDGTISCASCHKLAEGGDDGLALSSGVNNLPELINTPTVFNSSLNIKQFWDGRAKNLSDQLDGPVNNKREMDSSWSKITQIIKEDPIYLKQFNELFSDGVNIANIKKAIVRFEETLLTPNSRFDQYLKGNTQAITNEELAGYNLFKQYGCISCHQGMAIGGNMFQKLGIMKEYFTGEVSTTDLGRFNITKREYDRFVFKVPSLRNIALTGPYLHDGSQETLQDVVGIMLTYQLGVEAPDEDIQLIVQFLKTLTGEYDGEPL